MTRTRSIVNSKKAKVDDLVSFARKGIEVIGKVIELRETTVMVEILSEKVRAELDLPNSLTVVNHRNYEIIPVTSTDYLELEGITS